MIKIPYTFVPKEEHAKSYGSDIAVSTKSAQIVCNAIKKKPLDRSKRLLIGLKDKQRSLGGKYYTKAVSAVLELVESCEKNAEFMGLENEKLFVHASATHGVVRRRKRRKSGFGSGIKSTNIEIILIQKGKEKKKKSLPKPEAKKPTMKEKVMQSMVPEKEVKE